MKQFIIIGNSAAGISCVEAIRETDKASKILVISDEDSLAYCRCLISYYLSGEIGEEKILYRPDDFYKRNNVDLVLNKKVTRLDPKKGRVICEDKTQFNYDALLIATGASPKIPENIKGIKKTGVFGFRTIKDAKSISGLLLVTKSACVLGGGLIGLKAAYALRKRNIDVKIIIKSRQILSQMLDFGSSALVQKKLEENGIEVILAQDVIEIIGEGDIRALKLDSGKVLACSLVIVGKGVSPNTDLVKGTEIKVDEGIIADKFLETNIAGIYAAGDVCESFDLAQGGLAVNALWPAAVEQGKIAGSNMAGGKVVYNGSVGMNSLDFFGLPVVSLGVYKAQDEHLGELTAYDAKAGFYKKLVLKDDILIGAILAGDIRNSGVYLRLIREKINLAPIKEKLLDENFGYPDIKDLVEEREQVYV